MKTLSLIILSIIFISCEEGGDSRTSSSTIEPVPSNTFIENTIEEVEIEFIDGVYISECQIEDGVDFKYYLHIQNYELKIAKYEAVNGHCEGGKSILTAKYSINGNDLDYVETDYQFDSNFSNGTYICGLSQMVSGTPFVIDGLGCEDSYENKELNIEQGKDSYTINNIEFNMI